MSFGYKKLSIILALFVSSLTLNGCVTMLVGGAAAGVGAVVGSDSRTVDVQVDDQKIENEASSYLSNDRMRSDPKVFRVDAVSVNGNVLLVGQTTDKEYLDWAIGYIKQIKNVKRVFNYVENRMPISSQTIAHDAYLTSKVKGALLFTKKISSGRFKVYTENSVVYLLGYVTKEEGKKANIQASKVSGVKIVRPIYDYMDASGTPNSSDDVPVIGNTTSSSSSVSSTSSSSLASEAQSGIDNGGAVLLEDDDLLAPSSPASSL
ncbi:MAG: BON domain-containing protein [Succinatimonas hippei]|nr:BON domain-containing protein [Succinatimonas hippei]